MPDAAQPAETGRAHERVLDHIRDRIVAGELRPGDHLAPERELSEQLGLSRGSVREALRVLEAMGIVDARRGPGEAGGTVIREEPGEALSRLLQLEVGLARFSLAEVVEARVMLERRALIHMPRGANLSEAKRYLDEMRQPRAERRSLLAADLSFHAALVSAAGSRLATYLYRAIRAVAEAELVHSVEAMTSADWPIFWTRIWDEHAGIYAAAAAGEGRRAADLAERHITARYLPGVVQQGD